MKKVSALLISGASYLGLAKVALAAEEDPLVINPCPAAGTGGQFQDLCNVVFGGGLFQAVITTAFIVASLIALAFLIYGGIKWITSGGDKGGVEAARNIIVAALVGLVITFLAYFLINLVFNFFGLNFGTFTLPSLTPAGV